MIAFRIHPQAVNGVGDHVKSKSDKDQPDYFVLYKNSTQKVDRDHVFRVQVMESDAAAIGMKNGIGKQMIEVHQHGSKEDQVVFLPVPFIIPVGYRTYEDKM